MIYCWSNPNIFSINIWQIVIHIVWYCISIINIYGNICLHSALALKQCIHHVIMQVMSLVLSYFSLHTKTIPEEYKQKIRLLITSSTIVLFNIISKLPHNQRCIFYRRRNHNYYSTRTPSSSSLTNHTKYVSVLYYVHLKSIFVSFYVCVRVFVFKYKESRSNFWFPILPQLDSHSGQLNSLNSKSTLRDRRFEIDVSKYA